MMSTEQIHIESSSSGKHIHILNVVFYSNRFKFYDRSVVQHSTDKFADTPTKPREKY